MPLQPVGDFEPDFGSHPGAVRFPMRYDDGQTIACEASIDLLRDLLDDRDGDETTLQTMFPAVRDALEEIAIARFERDPTLVDNCLVLTMDDVNQLPEKSRIGHQG